MKQVDEDMRSAANSQEFVESIYEYKLSDKSSRVGVDLLKFYQLRLDKKNNKQALKSDRNATPLQLNLLEKLTLRLVNVRVNLKFRYNM